MTAIPLDHQARTTTAVLAAILVCCAAPDRACSQAVVATPPTYRNPFIDSPRAADPTVLRYRGRYYLYPTLDGRGYDVFVSDDLIHWQRRPKCFEDARGGVWAPDVFHDARGDGRLWLYYTADDPTGGKLIGVAVADDPLGPFVDRGVLAVGAIDAHLFQDDDGALFLYYVDLRGGFKIVVRPMADPVTPGGEPIVVIRPETDWETRDGHVTEGPWMLKRDGVYYLMYSGSGAIGPDYAIGYATSAAPTGPFTKYAGNPIAHRGNGVFGPGHHCVVEGPAGHLWMVYHQKNTEQRDWDRFLAIDPLWFDDQGVIHARTTRGTVEPGPGDDGSARFVRAGIDGDRPVWGLREGIRFAIWPGDVAGNAGEGGPRGLIRVGYPMREGGGYGLVNFVAVEPIVDGQTRRGFSELEASASDGRPGKRLRAGPPPGAEWDGAEWDGAEGDPYPGRIEPLGGIEYRLRVNLAVERFASGAHVRVEAAVRTDRPDELELTAFAEADSAPLRTVILTATMGNFERLRVLHLAERRVTAQELYGDWRGDGFAPHRRFSLHELSRTANGGALIAATTDEADPAAVVPDPDRPSFWRYPGRKLTQYWRKPAGACDDSLNAVVNARRVYWASEWPIPGGIAFENFELGQDFRPGQVSIFGLSELDPAALLAWLDARGE